MPVRSGRRGCQNRQANDTLARAIRTATSPAKRTSTTRRRGWTSFQGAATAPIGAQATATTRANPNPKES
jgi:hypothetical protein